eukprot:7933841-Pyramimonas_sp.AAC.1
MYRSCAVVHRCTSAAVAARTLVSDDYGRHRRSHVVRLAAMPSQRCIRGEPVPADLSTSMLVLCNAVTPARFE